MIFITRKACLHRRRLVATVFSSLVITGYLLLCLQLFVEIGDMPMTGNKVTLTINFYEDTGQGSMSRSNVYADNDIRRLSYNIKQNTTNVLDSERTFVEWQKLKRSACNSNMDIYGGQFVLFHGLVFNMSRVNSPKAGGEEMKSVMSMNQREQDEHYTISQGFFSIACTDFPSDFAFESHRGHLNEWLSRTSPVPHSTSSLLTSYVNGFTVIVKRYEYANLYHSMTDYYGAFLVMRFFQKSPQQTTILLFDTHPKGSLDTVWSTLFGTTKRVSTLNNNITRFRQAVWSIPGYDTPMYYINDLPAIPLIEDFRTFFLKQYGIVAKSKVDCNNLRLVAIWRKDYVAHPRNPTGRIERKVANEEELLVEANKTGLFSSITGAQLDQLTMKRQLLLISSADILVGMHGAGLTHVLFLPKQSGLIELLPSYFLAQAHFERLARWRRLHYIRWQNTEPINELSEYRTHVPPLMFRNLLFDMNGLLCGGQKA